MKHTLVSLTVRTVVPPLLGAAGAIVATMFPAYYTALCGGSPMFIMGG